MAQNCENKNSEIVFQHRFNRNCVHIIEFKTQTAKTVKIGTLENKYIHSSLNKNLRGLKE